jgi:molybdate transport system regulatory protein
MTTRRPIQHKLLGRLAVDTEFGAFLGGTRIRLLEAIERYGSITQAAKAVPLSYKAAWDAVDAINNLAEQPVVERSTGGRHGGGTTLTPYGKRLVAMYRAVEQEYQAALDRLAGKLRETESGDMEDFQAVLRRMSMKTSARNQFVGPVTSLRGGVVSFEVRIRLDAEHELAAVITRESAENLGLSIGMEVHAFVKASTVILLTDPAVRTSARNHLWGTVSRIHEGPVTAEVTVALPSGRLVTAVVTHESVTKLALEVGTPCCAVLDASSIILASFA